VVEGRGGVYWIDILKSISENVEEEQRKIANINSGSGGKALKTWYEWSSELSDIPLTRFDILGKELNDKGEEITKILGYSGREAANAYKMELYQGLSDAEQIQQLIGESLSVSFSAESLQGGIDQIQDLIIALRDIQPEAVKDRETFELWDNSMKGLIQTLSEFRGQLDAIAWEAVVEEGAQAAEVIDKMFSAGLITAFDARQQSIDNMKDTLEELVQSGGPDWLIEWYKNVIKAQQETLNFDVALKDLKDSLSNLAITELNTFFNSLGEAFGRGKEAAESMTDALVDYFTAILDALPMLLINAGLQLIGDKGTRALGIGLIAAGLSTSFLNGVREGIRGANEDAASTTNAQGNVYAPDGLTPFAKGSAFTNSVVTQPTVFPFAKGTGLMGEAGPEAILPLARTSTGDLGVRTTGGGVGSTVVNVKVENNASDVASATVGQDANGDPMIIIEKAVNSAIASGKTDRTMLRRYGVRPQGIRTGA
jgi:hypothetical protein